MLFALRGLQKLMGLIALYFIVRAISPEMYGQYQFILSVIALLSITTFPGFSDAATQSIARGHLGTYRLTNRYSFFGSLTGSLMCLIVASWYLWNENDLYMAVGFLMAATLFPFAKGLMQWNTLKTGQERFSSLVKWEGASAIAMQLAIIVGVLLVPNTFLIPLLCILVVPALQNLLLTWQAHKEIQKNSTIEEGSISYGIKTSIYTIPVIFSMHIEKFLLFTFLSPASLALFVAAEKIPEMVRSLIQDIGGVLAPNFARRKKYTKKLDNFFRYFSLVGAILIALFAFTVLPLIFTTLFGSEYKEAIPYTIAIMCSIAVGNTAMLRARYIRSQQDVRSIRNIRLIMAFTRITVALILVPIYGLAGAVTSVFIMRFVVSIFVNAIIEERYKTPKES